MGSTLSSSELERLDRAEVHFDSALLEAKGRKVVFLARSRERFQLGLSFHLRSSWNALAVRPCNLNRMRCPT